MGARRAVYASTILLILIAPLSSSSIHQEQDGIGGFDADGFWSPSVELEIHREWWTEWSRDKDYNALDDRLEWLIEQPEEIQRSWWKRSPEGSARVFVDYDHHPTDADIYALESIGVKVTHRFEYLDTVSASAPFDIIVREDGICLLYTSPSPRD